MTGHVDVEATDGRALISISDPLNPVRMFDPDLLQAIFKDHHLGDHEISRLRIGFRPINTFVVDFDRESLLAAQAAAPKSKLSASTLDRLPPGLVERRKGPATSVFANPDQDMDIEPSTAGRAMAPFSEREIALGTSGDVREIARMVFNRISGGAEGARQAAEDEGHGGERLPEDVAAGVGTKDYELLAYRFEMKIQQMKCRVYDEVEAKNLPWHGVFNKIEYLLDNSTLRAAEKYGYPTELDI